MNLDSVVTTAVVLLLAGLVARALSIRVGRTGQNLLLALGLFAGTGVLMAMGSIEMAGRYGYSTIMAFVAFSLVYVVSPLIFSPIRRLSEIVRFATPIDFLTFRYRNKLVAALACTSLILASIPLILAQLLAIESIANFMFTSSSIKPAVIFVTAILVIFMVLRSLNINTLGHLGWVMAAAGLLIIPALCLTTWTAIQSVFGGLYEMNHWVVDSGQRSIVQRMDSSLSLFIIFMAASFASPINFSLLMAHNITDRQAEMTAWAYPLMALLACIPVFPLLWSGIASQSYFPLQEYLYRLPAIHEQPLISGFACASIMLLALSMICSLILIASKIFINSFVLPNKNLKQQQNLSVWITRNQSCICIALILLCVGLSLVTKGRSITDYYLAGFSGLAQLTPGMLAVIYLPKANRSGFVAGLAAGISLWLVAIALPLILGDWQLSIPFSNITVHFGMQNWSLWAIEALLVNVTLSALFSIFGTMDKEQKAFAAICMADSVYIPTRIEVAQKSVPELTESLRLALGDAADEHIAEALDSLQLYEDEVRPAALRKLRDNINASLNFRYGILAATEIIEKSRLSVPPSSTGPEDIHVLESVLAIQGDQLTGIANELNKLRMHHRDMLNNLPIGVMSFDKKGEILKCNQTLENYIGIEESEIIGSSLSKLPDPWKSAIQVFLEENVIASERIPLESEGRTRWFSLQKSEPSGIADPVDAETGQEIILLIEDQTEAVTLTQTSIDNERLASVGRLAAGVAHEIGNPLTGIACLAQNLQHEDSVDHIADYSQQILSQTDRINLIVKSLINFSKGGEALSRKRSKVSVKKTVQEAIDLLTLNKTKSAVDYLCTIDKDLHIWGDHHQLTQIFLNLLSNARDASPDGGQVRVTVERDQQCARVIVSDQGSGIPEDIRAQIFEPFVTSKDPGEGTGLGLWIVFNLAKSLGADITIDSPTEENGKGTAVALSFPLST